jgi:subfamily B ATP-binding cassette protein MsbA
VKHYQRILAYLKPYLWPHSIVAVVCMLAFSAVEGMIPFVGKFTLDRVFGNKESWALIPVAVGVPVLIFLRGWLDFGASYLTDWIGQRVVTDLRNEISAHLQRLDLAFFNKQRAGQIVSRVTSDAGLLRNMVTDVVTSIFQDFTRLVILVGVAVYMDSGLALIAVGLFPVAAPLLWYFSTQLRQASRRQQEGFGRLNAMLHENVQGNRVVKAFGREVFEERRFAEHNDRLFRIAMRASLIRALPVTEMLAGVSIGLTIWFAGSSILVGTRTVGSFAGFFWSLFLLYDPFKKLVKANNTIQQGLAGAERVFGLLDTTPHVCERPGAVALTGIRDAIEFQDVSFAYEEEPVLRHIDLRIPVGQVVALVGVSGGGKSTLADLIPRFYDVGEGRITIDGVDIRDYTLKSLRDHMAVVTQFTFLFNDSVRNNIAYGEPDRPMEDIIEAARAANAHDFITELPQGYETHIGDLGVRLSGGQRQRLAIARAVLQNAPILILDEATSALDTESEGLVQEALERLMAYRTTVVVAHRLSTVRKADRIVVIVRGEIVESGSHDELLARGAEYRKLYELQFRDGGPEGNGREAAPSEPARKAAP